MKNTKPSSIRYDNVEIQYLYPFEISEWRRFKHIVLEVLEHTPYSKNPSRLSTLRALEESVPKDSTERKELDRLTTKYCQQDISDEKAFSELFEKILHENDGHTRDLIKLRHKKIKDERDCYSDECFFNFLSTLIENDNAKVVFDDSEKRGTRPYLLKNLPHIQVTIPGEDLLINNVDAFPNIKDKFLRNKKGIPYIRLQTNIKLLASGFGLLKVRCCLLTKEGLEKTIDEIVFPSESKSCKDNEKLNYDKQTLATMINKEIIKAIGARNENKNPALIKIYDHIQKFCQQHCLTTVFLKQNIDNLVDRANVLENNFSTSDVVDIQNLDRGTGWGKEPLFEWSTNGDNYGPEKLYNYFDYLINKVIIDPVRETTKTKLFQNIEKSRIGEKLYNKLDSTLSYLKRDNTCYAKEGIYPYILTFVAAPPSFSKVGAKRLGDIEDYFSKQLEKPEIKIKLARLLMKSAWEKIRLDLEHMKKSLENVFYSDLLYMAVNIRSTLCFYYLPSDPIYEYAKFPQLYSSVKYKRELEDTLISQRILWFMYSTFNHKVSCEIGSISRTFENLTTHIKKEEFNKIVDELSEVIMGIDDRKIAISEVMEDPLNRKGSTLFAEMLNRSSKVFRLKQLYRTLNDKLDRLDMLGLHVNQTTNELSSLVVQETSRATQFTIEVLEAFIIAVYFAEVTELAFTEQIEHLHAKPIIFLTVAIAMPLVALPLITLIRKSMSQFHGKIPVWQEWVEKIGFGAGLAMMSGLVFWMLYKSHVLTRNIGLLSVVFITIPLVLYVVWYRLNESFHSEHE